MNLSFDVPITVSPLILTLGVNPKKDTARIVGEG